MYSSYSSILPNVDERFVKSVEPLLLTYKVKSLSIKKKIFDSKKNLIESITVVDAHIIHNFLFSTIIFYVY